MKVYKIKFCSPLHDYDLVQVSLVTGKSGLEAMQNFLQETNALMVTDIELFEEITDESV